MDAIDAPFERFFHISPTIFMKDYLIQRMKLAAWLAQTIGQSNLATLPEEVILVILNYVPHEPWRIPYTITMPVFEIKDEFCFQFKKEAESCSVASLTNYAAIKLLFGLPISNFKRCSFFTGYAVGNTARWCLAIYKGTGINILFFCAIHIIIIYAYYQHSMLRRMSTTTYVVDGKCTIDRPSLASEYFCTKEEASTQVVCLPIRTYIWGRVHGTAERAYLRAHGVKVLQS